MGLRVSRLFANAVTVFPVTVQTAMVVEAKLTDSPDEAVALT